MQKRVVITLGRNGSRKVEAFGFEGESCKDATSFLDRIFGKPKSIELKDSYFSEEKQTLLDTDGLPGGGEFCGQET